MKINNSEVELTDLVKDDLHKNLHKLYGSDIYLNDNDLEVLKRYDFNIEKYSNIKSLILDIASYLDETDIEADDLEDLLSNLSEFNYYHNTNKEFY